MLRYTSQEIQNHPSTQKETAMEKSVLVPIADGTEELEAVAIIDILRRADAKVTVASVCAQKTIAASRGVVIVADARIEECMQNDYDLVVLPGGMPGAEYLRDSKNLIRLLKRQKEKDLLYGAICASPAVVLEHHGLLAGRRATCHPALTDVLRDNTKIASTVVVDGNCITGRGVGSAVEFALALVEQLYDRERRDEVIATLAM